MALAVLDGNQSATTLSSVVTGGEHIVAHSVVSLGSTAISNITSAVSGSVVSVSNFPASQSTTFGAVTGSVSVLNFPASQTIAGTVTANTAYATSVTGAAKGGTVTAMPVALVDSGVYGGSILAYNGTNTSLNITVRGIGGTSLEFASDFPVSGTVTIGSLPAISGTVTASGNISAEGTDSIVGKTGFIALAADDLNTAVPLKTDGNQNLLVSGTVTANGFDFNNSSYHPIPLAPFDEGAGGGKAVVAKIIDDNGVGLNLSAGVPISGTVTVGNTVTIAGTVTANPTGTQTIAGTVTANVETLFGSSEVYLTDADTDIKFSSANPFPISGTVTVGAMPKGALTTRFGTPTTASSVFATSAVTNASRKYLLIQNVTTQSNVITVGIGFTPTTTQGIQLTAGAGITFESSYIPTGAVYVLSSVTASNFTILEA